MTMETLEFRSVVKDEHIQLPDEVAAQIPDGATVRVTVQVEDEESLSPDEAWQRILATVRKRQAEATPGKPYRWRREDAYDEPD